MTRCSRRRNLGPPSVMCMACGGVQGEGGDNARRLVVDPGTIDSLFDAAFRGRDGHCTTDDEDEEIDRIAGEYASTFGEITNRGVRQLCDRVGMSASDVFLDMGSGVGKAVLQVALERGTRRSVGVELSRSRHRNAGKAVSALSTQMQARIGPTRRHKNTSYRNHPLLTPAGHGRALYRLAVCLVCCQRAMKQAR